MPQSVLPKSPQPRTTSQTIQVPAPAIQIRNLPSCKHFHRKSKSESLLIQLVCTKKKLKHTKPETFKGISDDPDLGTGQEKYDHDEQTEKREEEKEPQIDFILVKREYKQPHDSTTVNPLPQTMKMDTSEKVVS
ncbi:hypothetical protein Tco_0392923 [Tanacetum coccineum]